MGERTKKNEEKITYHTKPKNEIKKREKKKIRKQNVFFFECVFSLKSARVLYRPWSSMSEVQRVKLSLSNCMISVESL